MAHQAPHPPNPLFVLRGSKDAVNCVQFCPTADDKDRGRLLSGCSGGEVRVWNLETRRTECVLHGHGGKSVLWLHQMAGDKILSQGRDGNVLTWDLREGRGEVASQLPVNGLTFCKCAVYHQGRPLVAGPGLASEVCIFDLNSGKVVCSLTADKDVKSFGMPMCIAFLSVSRLLIGYEDGQLALWDTDSRKMLAHKQLHSQTVMCLDYSTFSERGVSGSADDQMVTWTQSEDTFTVRACTRLTNPGVSDLCIRRDDKVLASAGWDSRIRLFGWKNMKPLAVLIYHQQTINAVAFSEPFPYHGSARLLAAGSKDKQISLWSLYNPS